MKTQAAILGKATAAILGVVSIGLALSVGFGQQNNNDCDSLEKCAEALKANSGSSLVHFRIGEIFLKGQNYQAAANEFRTSLESGDREPAWTQVWSHINLGKIFDITAQRERAVDRYKRAQQTKDNTRGAQEEAAKYLESPYSGQ